MTTDTPTPAALAVEQRHRDAAADLIERYWPADIQMQQLASSYRMGHAQGTFANAFARFERDHLAALTTDPATDGLREARVQALEKAVKCVEEFGNGIEGYHAIAFEIAAAIRALKTEG